ncbi:DUF3632 domain-containing protein [Aspergillus glaucus CBS 516.65]|uniref:Uncharacterized protein n=1 Tax=Aspergillus glaucus CBS 516.65 TaxID=1160497 RepID=A0A1L9VT72_ASPGL|nr:hypothetical protein ASPGLDRAFT_32851 [Aspergillus glaucus CBS 516.65]OJJ87128.1 hypothetical protein ASPGLDRAFT_32851 [Aspergillus glaucus CBS 516.65]
MTTLDELSQHRNWFRGSPDFPFTPLVEAYMADEIDLPTAVSKIVQPVNEAYSSGDVRETEVLLWDLWYTILWTAKKTPRVDPADQKPPAAVLDPSTPSKGHTKLLSLLETIKTQPDPPFPSNIDQKTKDNWIYEDGELWSVLSIFGPATREVLNDSPGAGSGYKDLEIAGWENLNAFLAHVTRRDIADMGRVGIFELRHALEQRHKDDTKGDVPVKEARKVRAFVAAAGVWVIIMGEELWARKGEKKSEKEGAESGVRAKGDVITKERWKLWIEKFEFLSCREDLDIDTRELAAQGAAILMRVHT